MRVREIEDDFSQNRDTTGTVEVGGIATGHIQYEGDNDWFAVELTAGETYKIDLLKYGNAGTLSDPYLRGIYDEDGRYIRGTTDESSGFGTESEVLFHPLADGTYYIAAGSYLTGYRDQDVGTYTLQVSVDDYGDDADTAGTVEVGGISTGEIQYQGDRDRFAVTLEAGKTYQIDMEGSSTDGGSLENPAIYIFDTNGNYIFGGISWRTTVERASMPACPSRRMRTAPITWRRAGQASNSTTTTVPTAGLSVPTRFRLRK